MTNRTIAAFDFDGTITKRDTLVPFLRRYGLWNFVQPSVETLKNRRQRGWRDTLKENILRQLFLGFPVDRLEKAGQDYATSLPDLYRQDIVKCIEDHRDKGHELVLVTASLGCYVRPAAASLGFDHVIAVELASISGRLTGEIAGLNVRGAEKARRLRRLIGLERVDLWAYGNSSGDKEMLEMAQYPRKV
ncbi:MAG: HAD-IB family hydrolase [Acidimicrobiales bacterium]|nr:HAD-IB family hydrolase [Acidimicrobiales bacterium]